MHEKDTFSDDQVIQSVLDGKTQNFEILLNRYKKKIINFINKMIYDYDEAQSICQDVFIKVYTTLDRYRGEENFQAFIFTIAKNLTLNFIKRKKRMMFFPQIFSRGEDDQRLSYEAPQERILNNQIQEKLIIKAMKSIKENQRLALIMKIYLDLSYKQIAEITGWSIPKIETLISRGKTALKKEIFMQEKNDENVLKLEMRTP